MSNLRGRAAFDWRLALPFAAALAIASAGYLSLRPPTVTPAELAIAALPGDDVAALVDVASLLAPVEGLLPGEESADSRIVAGALEVGWVDPNELPGALDGSDLDDEAQLELLKELLG